MNKFAVALITVLVATEVFITSVLPPQRKVDIYDVYTAPKVDTTSNRGIIGIKKRKAKHMVHTPHWMKFIATWYNYGTITKSGKPVQRGVTLAVDPRVIPLGSTVEVKFADGHTHVYQAQDTGGDIKGNRVDIYNPSYQQCINNGRQTVWVRILKMG